MYSLQIPFFPTLCPFLLIPHFITSRCRSFSSWCRTRTRPTYVSFKSNPHLVTSSPLTSLILRLILLPTASSTCSSRPSFLPELLYAIHNAETFPELCHPLNFPKCLPCPPASLDKASLSSCFNTTYQTFLNHPVLLFFLVLQGYTPVYAHNLGNPFPEISL